MDAGVGETIGRYRYGGPCTKGSFSDLDDFSDYVRYYIASDLPNGGYTMDQWTLAKHRETDPETQYHDLFSTSESLEDALRRRIDLKRKRYEYSRTNMITNEVSQANYLYSFAKFRTFSHALMTFLENVHIIYSIRNDVYEFMVENGA